MEHNEAHENEYFVNSPDSHEFVGRVFDLAGPIQLSFQTMEEVNEFPDCLYVLTVEYRIGLLTRRTESLNLCWKMLNVEEIPIRCCNGTISRYEWLQIVLDVFLSRFVSISDCCLLLINDVLELGIDPKQINIRLVRKNADHVEISQIMERIQNIRTDIREERNLRVHRAEERGFTDDDTTFWIASLFESDGQGIKGKDRFGRKIDLSKTYDDAVENIGGELKRTCSDMERELESLYESLDAEFDWRFREKYDASSKQHVVYGKGLAKGRHDH